MPEYSTLWRPLLGTVIVSSEFPESVTVSCAFHEQPVMCRGGGCLDLPPAPRITGGNRESDAGTLKKEAHALTPELELMHGAKKQGGMHHFPTERLGIQNNRPLCVVCSRLSTFKKRSIF